MMQSIAPQAKTYTLSFSKAAHHTCQHTNLGNIMRDHSKNLTCPARRYKLPWKDWADLKSSAKRAKVFWSVKGETAVSKTQFLFTSFFLRPKPEGLAMSWFSSPFLLGASPHSLVNFGRSSVPVRVWLMWYYTGIFAAIWTSTVCFPICNHFPSMSSTSQPSPTGQHISRTPFLRLLYLPICRKSNSNPTTIIPGKNESGIICYPNIIQPDIVTSKTEVVPWRPRNQFYPSLSHWFENHTAESSDTWRFADAIIVS